MKEITDLTVGQVRVYQVNVVPFNHFFDERNIQSIRDVCEFQSIDSLVDGENAHQAVIFKNGVFSIDDEKYVVNHLTFETRRVNFKILADSSIASRFFEQLTDKIITIDKDDRFKNVKPILLSQTTTCIVTLDVSFEDIFSPKLIKYLEGNVIKNTKVKKTKNHVRPIRFSALISYQPTDKSYDDQFVTIDRKFFTVEPRARTSEKERRYYTESPTDSDSHLELIEEFEKIFKKS